MHGARDGSLTFESIPFPHRLRVRVAEGDREGWHDAPLSRQADDRYTAHGVDAKITLTLTPQADAWAYALSVQAPRPARVQLALELPDAEAFYPMIPAVLFGDNNLAHVEEAVFPHLTAARRDEPNCSPYWEFRADRASHPAAMAAFHGGVAALSIDPYTDNATGVSGRDAPTFVRNGLFARAVHAGAPGACGVTLGYRNTPLTYVNKRRFEPPTAHSLRAGTVTGTLHLAPAADRRALHDIVRALHGRYRRPATHALTDAEGIRTLTDALVTHGWIEADGNFADLKWDFERSRFVSLRGPNDEIGWTGGAPTAYPLLVSGQRAGNPDAIDKATRVLDLIAATESINPRSGWLWDMRGADGTCSNAGWWAGMTGGAHCAYTNGEAVSYLLLADRFARQAMTLDRPAWRDTALKVLEQALEIQQADGGFGYTYAADDGRIADPEGFAGCWFIPALALAHELTGDARYLEAARRGMAYYYRFVRDLCCWGTPMDTFKAIDQEGVLAFIRAARLLHESTLEDRWLEMLRDGALYEYLWRFVIRARPQVPPLAGSDWHACGGSITSTSNPHIHPMGLLISGDLHYLAEQTGDAYHHQRMREGIDWALNCLSLYPGQTRYGAPGTLTERFCPSDGLLIETWPDGSPASVWFTYHIWGAANVLEGLLDVSAKEKRS